MKTVFTDASEVAHLWANQTQDSAKNSGHNFFFSGKIIYSYGYHFPIAKHVINDKGEKAILFTERSYSVTTSKHIAIVRHAVSNDELIYCFNPENTHGANFNSWASEAESVGKNLIKAKKPEKYLSQLEYIKSKVNRYASFFSIEIPGNLQSVLSIGNKTEYAEYEAKKEAFEIAAKLKAEKELQKRHKKELKEWLSGKNSRLYTRDGYDYLRVTDNRIETTQAVKIPFEVAKKLWQSISSNTAKVGDKVLDYTINEVGKEIEIGCHTFKTDYLLNFGKNIFAKVN
jgi:hypothetical protein